PNAHTDFNLTGLRNYSGILTHCQLRADKSDCHPGFDWAKLITDCKLQTTAQLDIKAMAAPAQQSVPHPYRSAFAPGERGASAEMREQSARAESHATEP